jgi:hypothetical protein
VVADTVYGTARGLRGWLKERGRWYVLAVPATQGIYHEGSQRQARTVAKHLSEEAWFRASGREARQKGFTTGLACPYLIQTRRRVAGCFCAGASKIPPIRPTTWPMARLRRPSTS